MSRAAKSKHHHVLLVEDLDYECTAIASAIEDVMPGCMFLETKSVAEAEAVLEKEDAQVDLIVLDLKLGASPKDGLVLLEPNRVWHRRRPPVIVCTAVPRADAHSAYEAGASAFISKLDGAATESLQKAVVKLLLGEAVGEIDAAVVTTRTGVESSGFDVFLAHNSKDRAFVEALAERLRGRGLRPWLAVEQIPPGRWFQDVIQEVIPKVKCAAVIIGTERLGKWEALELRTFISQCVDRWMPVIPVLLPGVDELPDELLFLKELNWVRFTTSVDEDAGLDNLVWGIKGKKERDDLEGR